MAYMAVRTFRRPIELWLKPMLLELVFARSVGLEHATGLPGKSEIGEK